MTPTREEFLHIGNGKYVFYFLIYLSLAIMAFQIAMRVRVWLKGKPITWGRSQQTGWRYWLPTRNAIRPWLANVGTYVLAQRKVRTSRRKSGAPMHLLLFYGFLSMFLATTLLAINTYGPVQFHRGNYYLSYEFAFDILGLMFVVGSGWALVRRIALERKTPSPLPPDADLLQVQKQQVDKRRKPLSSAWQDYATLALLLAIGLSGYWLEASRLSNYVFNGIAHDWDRFSIVGWSLSRLQGPVSDGFYVFVWWFHAALIMVFFAVLPRMRIRHIVMAILATAGKSEHPWGQLRTITVEEVEATERVGASHAADYSRWHLMSLDACMESGRCTEVCPAWNVGKVLNPKQIVQDLRGAMVSGEAIAPAVSEEALWACTTCNACVEACPVLIRHVDLIVDARRNLVAEGALSGSGATMLRQVASTGHAWGQPASEREKWMEGLDIPLCRDGGEFDYLFWVGCAGATDPGAVKTTKATAALLKKAGVKFACLGREEACTGDPARRVGEEFLYQDKAAQNISVFQRYGVEKVLTACPHCFNTLKNEYGEFGATLEVFHHSQLLSNLVSKGQLLAATPPKGEVAYHDPCYLARVNNESDAPRSLMGGETGLNELAHVPGAESRQGKLAEPEHYGRKTLCCGAGGGRMWMEEPPTQRPSNRRAEELLATGAKTVAVGCPFCRIMIGDSLKQVRPDEDIRLVDMAELLQDANR